jgi:hypothetical protein
MEAAGTDFVGFTGCSSLSNSCWTFRTTRFPKSLSAASWVVISWAGFFGPFRAIKDTSDAD